MEDEKKETGLTTFTTEETAKFRDVVKNRYLEEYADQAIQLMKEWKKVERGYNVYKVWVDRLEAGDMTVLEEYKKKRHKLEYEDDFDL